jgi:hypothetical protein
MTPVPGEGPQPQPQQPQSRRPRRPPPPRRHPVREPGGPPPRPVAASLDAVARNLGGAGGPALLRLLGDWPAVVGDQLAGHCRPLSLRGGTLTIGADESAWGAQLGWLDTELRRALDDALGAGVVTRIAVRVRPR